MLSQIDDLLQSVEGLQALIITVSPDNLLYDYWSRHDELDSADESATFFGDLLRVHFEALETLHIPQGNIQITVEVANRVLVVRNVRSSYVASFLFDDETPYGLLRMQVRQLFDDLLETLPFYEEEEEEEETFDAAEEAEARDGKDEETAVEAEARDDEAGVEAVAEPEADVEAEDNAADTAEEDDLSALASGPLTPLPAATPNAPDDSPEQDDAPDDDVQDPPPVETPEDPVPSDDPSDSEDEPVQDPDLDLPIIEEPPALAPPIEPPSEPTPLEAKPAFEALTSEELSARISGNVPAISGGLPDLFLDTSSGVFSAVTTPDLSRMDDAQSVVDAAPEEAVPVEGVGMELEVEARSAATSPAPLEAVSAPPSLRAPAPEHSIFENTEDTKNKTEEVPAAPAAAKDPRINEATYRALFGDESASQAPPSAALPSRDALTAIPALEGYPQEEETEAPRRLREPTGVQPSVNWTKGRDILATPTAGSVVTQLASVSRLAINDQTRKVTTEHRGIAPEPAPTPRFSGPEPAPRNLPPRDPAFTYNPANQIAITRGARILEHLAARVSTPQNILVRVAVHSRIPLDALKSPDTLSADQVLRIEDAACTILGVSKLDI